jgi:hypothetical protein
MNMILHGAPDADIQNEDTIGRPLHKEEGELMLFDRVISNPPFSQNYSRSDLDFPERFRYGFAPETGKKADLMFAQPQRTLPSNFLHLRVEPPSSARWTRTTINIAYLEKATLYSRRALMFSR